MRVFRIAIPSVQHGEARAFYEQVLGITADDTVPSRLYFHCGDVIVALIDWTVEQRGAEFHPTPDDLYFATDELDAVYDRAVKAGAPITDPGVSVPSIALTATATSCASSTIRHCSWVMAPSGPRSSLDIDRPISRKLIGVVRI